MAKKTDIYEGLDPLELEGLKADLERWQRKLPKPGPSKEELAAAAAEQAKGSVWNKMKRGAWRGMENLSRYGEGAAWLPIELLKAPGSIDEALGGKPGILQRVKKGAQHIQDELHHGTQFFEEMAGVPKEESALPTSERFIPKWVPEVAGSFTQPAPYLSPIKKLLSKAAIKPALEGAGKMAGYGAGVAGLQEFNKPEGDRDWLNVPKSAAVMGASSPVVQRLLGSFMKSIPASQPARPTQAGLPGAAPAVQLPPAQPRQINPRPAGAPPPGGPPVRPRLTDYTDVTPEPVGKQPQLTDYIDVPFEPIKTEGTLPPFNPTRELEHNPIPNPTIHAPGPVATGPGTSIQMPGPVTAKPNIVEDFLAGQNRPSMVKPGDLLPDQLNVNPARDPFLIKRSQDMPPASQPAAATPGELFPQLGITPGSTSTRPGANAEVLGGVSPISNKPVSESDAFGDSIVDFLRAKGGVHDQGGEVGRMEIGRKPFQKGLIKQGGLDLDTAANMAHESGYLPERDINALLQSIENEARGKPVYSPAQTNPLMEDLFFQQREAGARTPETRPSTDSDAEFFVTPEEAIHPSDLPENVLPPLEEGYPDPTIPHRGVSGGEPSKTDIHDLADAKGIAWDHDPDFMDFTKQVTGKSRLDALNPPERAQLFHELEGGQQSIDMPPPTIGERPIIGREVAPEDDAPLFNLSQREPAPEQAGMFDRNVEEWNPDQAMGGGSHEHGGPEPNLPAGREAATEVHQETQTDLTALDHIKNILNDERGSTHLGGGVGPIERVLTQRRFAEKHPQDFGPVYQRALDRFEWAAAQKHDLHQLGKPYYLLDPKDRAIVDQYLRDRRRNRQTGLPPALQPAADAVDRMMQSSYQLINDVLDVKGLPPMRQDPNYVPFARSGDYLTIATLPNGAKWVSAATTLREAEAMEKKLMGQFPGVNVLVKTTSNRKGDLPTLDFGTMAMLEKAGIIDRQDFENAVQQFDLPPGFSAHMRNAQKILGESKDLLDPIERYIDGVTNYTARFLHDDEMKAAIEKIADPAVKQYAEKYRDYINTKPQEYSRLRGGVAVWDLALNIGSMFQNATQVPFVGFPVLESHLGKAGAAKVFKDAIKSLLHPTPRDLAVLQMAEREGHIRPINAEELFGARSGPGQELELGSPYVQRQIEKGWLPPAVGGSIRGPLDYLAGGTEKVLAKGGDVNLAIGQKLSYAIHRLTGSSAPIAKDKATRAHPVLMQGFASIEEINRRLGILLGDKTGEAMGKTPGESYEFAKKISRDINYDYSPASRAQAFRGMGAPLGLFMTFQTEYMATISKLIRQQAKMPNLQKLTGPATTAMLAFWTLAGIKGLPFVEDVDLYGPDPGMISQNLPDWLYQGPASALTGRDISAKFKMGPRVPYDMLHGTVDASQIPVAQPFVNAAQGTDWFMESPMDSPSVQKYIERLLPPAARHTAQAARWAGFGPAGEIEDGTVGTLRGHTPGPTEEGKRDFFHPSDLDIAGKAASFTPLELSKQYTRGRIQQRLKDQQRSDTTALVNSAAHHLDRNGEYVPSPALEDLRVKHPHTYKALMKAHHKRQSGTERGSTEEIYRKAQEPKVIER